MRLLYRQINLQRSVLVRYAAIGLVLLPSLTQASSFQIFNGLNYGNPAQLSWVVKDLEMVAGDDYVMPTFRYTGNTVVPKPTTPPNQSNVTTNGSSQSKAPINLAYGHLAKRLSTQWVADIQVTQPFAMNIIYPNSSPIRYMGTGFTMNSVDIAPTLSYQFNTNNFLSRLSIGGGVDALHLSTEITQNYPSLPYVAGAPTRIIGFGKKPDAQIDNQMANWAYGWHAGAMYRIFTGTLIGASYYSDITPTLKGASSFSGYANTRVSAQMPLPASTHLNLIQIFSEKLFTNLTLHYTQWSRLQNLTLTNIAGPISSGSNELHYRDTWRVDGRVYYKLTHDLNVGTLLAFDESPSYGNYKGPLTPSGDTFTAGINAEYQITRGTTVGVNYAHVFVKDSPINKITSTGITAHGTVKASADVIGARLTIKL